MDVTTHSITLISIIIGLGLTVLLLNLNTLIRERARVRWDPLPLLWTANVFFVLLNYWWAVVRGLDGSRLARTAADFGLLLIHPVLLFLMCASVLPRVQATEVFEMRSAYVRDRKTFFAVFALYLLGNWVLALVMNASFGWNILTIQRALVSVLVVSLLVINRRGWDWLVAVGVMIAAIVVIGRQAVR